MRLALVGFASGTALLQMQPALPPTAALCALGLAGGAGFLLLPRLPRAWQRAGAAFAAALLLGLAWSGALAAWRLADELPGQWEGRDVEISGVVASLPQAFERGARFEFEVDGVATAGARVPAHVQLTWYGGEHAGRATAAPDVHPGQRWTLSVRLRRPHGSANPQGFDYEAWLLERGIRATGYVRSSPGSPAPVLLRSFTWSLESAVDRLRERIRAHLQRALGDAPYGGVIIALAVGDQRAIDSDDWQVFTRTGVSHLMSISGLHVTMIASLGAWLVFAVWRWSARYTLRLLLLLPAPQAAALGGFVTAFAYCLLAGFAIPAQRTLYMLGVAAWALWRGWFGSATRVLALALGVVALLDPWAALEPGFWLSFGAVALLLLVGAAQQGKPAQAGWFKSAVAAQFAITVGLVPLTIALFQQISLVGPLANALAIPAVSLVITPLALLAAVLPFDFLAQFAHAAQSLLMRYLEWLSSQDWAVWQHAAPPLPLVILAVAGSLWMLVPWWWSWRVLGALWMLPMFLQAAPRPAPGELWLTVLDVGQGLSVVARTARHTLLYDTGPQYSPDSDGGNRVVLPFLRGGGIAALDGLVVTHDDIDHSGGALSVLNAVPVTWVASPLKPTHPINQAAGARARRCEAGQSWDWDGVHFEMLHPAQADYAHLAALPDNAQGCVLKISAQGRSVLLPADTERDVEARLVAQQPALLKSDVLVAPHHGSRTSSSGPWIAAVQPAAVIFPVGYRNRFHHPAADVVQRYVQSGARLWRTDEQGAISVRLGAGGLAIEDYRSAHPRYWYGR
jgi:competence protein ComEC